MVTANERQRNNILTDGMNQLHITAGAEPTLLFYFIIGTILQRLTLLFLASTVYVPRGQRSSLMSDRLVTFRLLGCFHRRYACSLSVLSTGVWVESLAIVYSCIRIRVELGFRERRRRYVFVAVDDGLFCEIVAHSTAYIALRFWSLVFVLYLEGMVQSGTDSVTVLDIFGHPHISLTLVLHRKSKWAETDTIWNSGFVKQIMLLRQMPRLIPFSK